MMKTAQESNLTKPGSFGGSDGNLASSVSGLDAAIADACEDQLMEAADTARIIMNKEIYCDSYIDLFKAKQYSIYRD
jgi:hypothetical protein